MKPQLTQKELSNYYNNGDVMVVAYKRIYEIKHSHGAQEYIMQQVHRSFEDLPLTRRGRYIAMTPTLATSLITH